MIPVVTVHGGDVKPGSKDEYLRWTLRQASEYAQRVILLGGPKVKPLAGKAEYYNYLRDWSMSAGLFAKYAYVKMSYYTDVYDLAVFKRYFVLRDFMEAEKLDLVFSCDSDVMLYSRPEDEASVFGVKDFAYCIPENQYAYRWSASSHAAYFSRDGIERFCDFIVETYTTRVGLAKLKRKWEWHQKQKKSGGVCDMTLLWLFYLENKDVVNLSRARGREPRAFDHHVNTPENELPNEYEMEGRKKRLVWRNGKPYGHNLITGEEVRFAALHLQGGAKKLAESYYRRRQ